MSSTNFRAARRLPKFVRIVRARPRLFLCALLCLVMVAVLPRSWPRLLVSWDAAVAVYLLAVYEMMARADLTRIRRQSALQDEGRFGVLVLTVLAALASLGAIVAELGSHPGDGRTGFRLTLATVTIALSWGLVHTIFALHYAHEFHADRRGGGGLAFPGAGEPTYWDFVYFSFVIGMTSQVSDVAVTSKTIRRTVTAHGIVSFFFNAALLALTVNIAASAI